MWHSCGSKVAMMVGLCVYSFVAESLGGWHPVAAEQIRKLGRVVLSPDILGRRRGRQSPTL